MTKSCYKEGMISSPRKLAVAAFIVVTFCMGKNSGIGSVSATIMRWRKDSSSSSSSSSPLISTSSLTTKVTNNKSTIINNNKNKNKSSNVVHPLEIKGYKFFNSITGENTIIRGIDYYPRPNFGKLNNNSLDLFTTTYRHIWERDIQNFKDLGINSIRLYSVDPTSNHDEFMCELGKAGIYVIVGLASSCSKCEITKETEAPNCYPHELKKRGQQIISNFAKYSNTLAFSAGNEINHNMGTPSPPEFNAPCQKKFIRDMRAYIQSCKSMRKIPVGLVTADTDRDENALYYNCRSDPSDELENAEWYGLNTYVYCDGSVADLKDASGFNTLIESFASYQYSIPVLLTEFGCLSESFPTINGYEGQRNFLQAKWLVQQSYDEEGKGGGGRGAGGAGTIQDYFAGGYVFEYVIEKENNGMPYPYKKFGPQNFGIGYFSPENCTDMDIPCKYNKMPCFDNLKKAYDVNNNNDTMFGLLAKDTFHISQNRTKPSKCPKQFPNLNDFVWEADEYMDLVCPTNEEELSFTCNVDASATSHQQNSTKGEEDKVVKYMSRNGRMKWLLILISLVVLAALVVVLIEFVYKKKWNKKNRLLKSGNGDGSVSSEEESTGLLILPRGGGGAGDDAAGVGEGNTEYMSINSDSESDGNKSH